jgi:hypothetical protein
MGEILGLGITHYPGLSPRAARPGSLRRLLNDPGLPEHLRTPAGWPAAMREEWGDDEGASFAARHRDALAKELTKARRALDAFAPDFVVIWGDDQYENFREDVIPAFCVLAYDEVRIKPWAEKGSDNAWGEAPDTEVHIRGHRDGAKHLAAGLIGADFDVAYAYEPLHEPLGHAFLNSVLYLDWDRRGFPYPVVPFSVNCYGRRIIALRGAQESLADPVPDERLDPPSPSPARCFDLGRATARALARGPWRVALVASSSWSHAFLTKKHHYVYPDTAADRQLFAALERADYATWRRRTLEAVEDSGQQELLNWFCLVGAMAELGRTPTATTFVESAIMNSNKVVAIFGP